MRIFAVLALAVLLIGCSEYDKKKHAAEQTTPRYMIYSPNAEPLNGGLLGKPSCQQAVESWFNRVSAGSGHITKEAFLRDSRVQFNRMDIDHNGYIVSEELDRFREPYRQQPAPHKEEKQDTKNKHSNDKSKDANDTNQPDLSFTTADPVMSADSNLDFKVTPEEFFKQAENVFAKLDANHDGLLDRAEVMTFCPSEKKE